MNERRPNSPTPGRDDGGEQGGSGVRPSNGASGPQRSPKERSQSDFGPQVQAPFVSLPKGGGSIQSIDEKFSVNPATGTASLDIPIFTPDGRDGFGPDLSLSYDSGGGNGLFGHGFQLGLSSISRKTAKGLPTYGGSARGGETSDTFILSGLEDLVPVGSENIRQTSDGHWEVQTYQPRVEESFSRIERWSRSGKPSDTFWRVVSANNIESLFGRTAEARVADPADPSRIFRWHLQQKREPKGNVIRYCYKQEDAAGVDGSTPYERRRLAAGTAFAQRYPKRLQYGNRTARPHADRDPGVAPALVSLESSDPSQNWLFEVVFDYGEHADDAPSPSGTDGSWDRRPDPFSSYRSGFEIRTYRLCQRVLAFHHIDAEGNDATRLVRTTDFSYRTGPKLTHLESVTQTGYAAAPASADAEYRTEALPPVELAYTGRGTAEFGSDDALERSDLKTGDVEVPAAVDGNRYRWVDLDGEGIDGLLSRHGGAWFYRANRGDGALAPAETVDILPSVTDLGNGQRLVDLDGDGQIDLAQFQGNMLGFHERGADGGWSRFEAFRSVPNIDWQQSNLRLLDLTGDGRSDVLITEDRVLTLYSSRGEDGFDAAASVPKAIDEDDGPAVVFADGTESIRLADMSGDGLADIVRIRNGSVHYWPNLGYGRFGEKVTMASAPQFDAHDSFQPSRLRLADIDGTGMTDLIYLAGDEVRYWFNQSGNDWSAVQTVPGLPSVDDLSSVQVTDLLGHGTACLVWSSGLPESPSDRMQYVDLMGGVKPHLLRSIDNNRGRTTTLEYAPSTKFYLQDKREGRQWATKLPFPVQVVEKVITKEHVTGTRQTTRYRYHHGYFDGKEREFRGFGMVERWDTENLETFRREHDSLDQELKASLHRPPVHSKTWYHTGAYLDGEEIGRVFAEEYYDGDPDAAQLPDTTLSPDWSTRECREAARALRGKMLRREVYAQDDSDRAEHPYQTQERSYRLQKLASAGEDRHAVFHPYRDQSVSYTYERRPADPRIHHQLTLDIDDLGNPTRTAEIGYPRRSGSAPPTDGEKSAQEERKVWVTETDYVNEPDLGGQGYYRVGVPTERRQYEVSGLPAPNDTLYGVDELRGHLDEPTERPFEAGPAPERDASAGPAVRIIRRRQIEYWTDDLSGARSASKTGALALPRQTYELALTPGLIDEVYGADRVDARRVPEDSGYVKRDRDNWWAPSGVRHYDPQGFYRMSEFVDPFRGSYHQTYDALDLFPKRLEKPKLTLGDGSTRRLEMQIQYDYRAQRPRTLTDPNGTRETAHYDPLGMVEARAVRGSGTDPDGDSLQNFSGGVPEAVSASPSDPAAFLNTLVEHSHALLQGATERVFVDLDRYVSGEKPICVFRIRRRTHASDLSDGEETTVERSVTFLDGKGREVMTKEEVAPGPAPKRDPDTGDIVESENGLATERADPRWTGTGRTVFDNKGKPVKQYEPFFSASPRFEEEKELVERGVTPVMRYDPLGRLVRKDFPDGSFERVEFDAWGKTAFDRNDTVTSSDWYSDRHQSSASSAERRSARLAKQHDGTPTVTHLDPLGRPYRTVRDDGRSDVPTTKRLDLNGKPLAVKDARGRDAMAYRYDLLGRRIRTESIDAGTRRQLRAADGSTMRRWDDRGHLVKQRYDAMRRPTITRVTDPTGTTFTAEQVIYGIDAPNAANQNLLGKPYEQYDGAGVVRNARYDIDDNLIEKRRTLTDAHDGNIDWSTSPALEPVTFVEARDFDAVGRPIERMVWRTESDRPASPSAGNRTFTNRNNPAAHEKRIYTKAGRISSIESEARGTGATPYLGAVTYNARGQRKKVHLGGRPGDAVMRTTHTYDDETFRLDTLTTERVRDGRTLQDRSYTYDPVGNVTKVADGVGSRSFAGNQIADPGARYEYDPLYRLTRAEGRERTEMGRQPSGGDSDAYRVLNDNSWSIHSYNRTYKYDDVDNIQSVTHSSARDWTRQYNYVQHGGQQKNNRLGSTEHEQQTWTYDHDVHGNMTSMPHLQRLHWSYRDELRRVKKSENQSSHYQYDAGGQRVRKVEDKEGALTEERIYLDGFEIYRRRRGDSLERRRETLHVGGTEDSSRGTGRVALVETKTHDSGSIVSSYQPQVRYQLADHLESVILEMSGEARIITYEEYYPYGETAFQWGRSETEVKQKKYRYTRKERDSLTGFYYHGARYYAAWLGRWTAPDPKGMRDGTNIFAYGLDNPIRMSDPHGFQSSDKVDFLFEPVQRGKSIEGWLPATESTQVPKDLFKQGSGLRSVLEKDPTLGKNASQVWVSKNRRAIHLEYSGARQADSITYTTVDKKLAKTLAKGIASKFPEFERVGSIDQIAQFIDAQILAARTIRAGKSSTTRFLVREGPGEMSWVEPKEPLVHAMKSYLDQPIVNASGDVTRKGQMKRRAVMRTASLGRMASNPISAILGGAASAMGAGVKGIDIATALGKVAWAPISASGKSAKRSNQMSTSFEKNKRSSRNRERIIGNTD